jgi:two-component system response regulator FixJ
MSNFTIYVIDDDDAARDGLVFLLTTSNFVVQDYHSARAFLDGIHVAAKGCVITDLSMPEMSGIDLLREIRVLGFDWPVIVVTGHGDVTLAVEALRAGATAFIEKPYDADALLNAVAAAIQEPTGTTADARRARVGQMLAMLSVEERRVFDGLTGGKSAVSLAQDLRLSSQALEIHRANVMTKLQASSFSDLIRMALLSPAEPPAED